MGRLIIDAINEIIRFSTIPGTSRHHWGTDIDINGFDILSVIINPTIFLTI